MPHPTLVIIPTSFCPSSFYDGQVECLRSKGYSAHSLDPPSFPANYMPEMPAPTMYDDARFIHDFVAKIIDEGTDVVILAHGYGGCPASQSLKELTCNERTANGNIGGVVRMAFLTGVVPNVGENIITTIGASGSGGAPEVDIDQYGWMAQTNPQKTARMVFNSLPLDAGIKRSKSFGRHTRPAFMSPLTHPGYRDLPVSWYFCEEDLSVTPEIQQTAIDVIEQSWHGTQRQGRKVDITRNRCDHMPCFSAPDHLNAWIERVILAGDSE